KNEYNMIKKLHLNPDYQQIIIASILQPALIHACYKLEQEEYEEKAWFRTLMIRWELFKQNTDIPAVEDIPEFVEHLLQDPTSKLINVLEHMDERESIIE